MRWGCTVASSHQIPMPYWSESTSSEEPSVSVDCLEDNDNSVEICKPRDC